jgi:hypothetical protein
MEISQGKIFPKPEAGMYLGTIIDVVDMPNQQTQYGPKNKVRIVWTLALANGAPYLDAEGSVFEATVFPTAMMSEKSSQPLFRNLFKIVLGVLGQAPPLITSSQQLEQLLLGRSNGLLITKEPNLQKPGDFYSNVVGITPLAPGQVPPRAPANFQRAKDRPKTQAGPQGQPVQTYAVPPATTAAAPAVGQPTAEQIAAYLKAQQQQQSMPAQPQTAPIDFTKNNSGF